MSNITRTSLVGAMACALVISGCIVHATSNTGVLEVRWDNSPVACSGIAGVRVRIEKGGQLYDESPQLACSKGFHSFALEPGHYDVVVVGLSGSGKTIRTASLGGLQVESDTNTLSPELVLKSGTGSGDAGVRVKWTVAGMAPATGCAQLSLDSVSVTVFDSKLTKALAQTTVACTVGQVAIDGLAPGDVWLQIDGVDKNEHAFYGNLNVIGPIGLASNTITALAAPENIIDLRASINIPWQFSNGKTCGGNGISIIKVEVRRPGAAVIVPLTANDAAKPCDLGPSNSLSERAIDLQFIKPTCNIPPGANGLIVCGILDKNLDIRAVALDEQSGAVGYGGWLKIRDLQLGTFTNNDKPLYLESCGASNVDCSMK